MNQKFLDYLLKDVLAVAFKANVADLQFNEENNLLTIGTYRESSFDENNILLNNSDIELLNQVFSYLESDKTLPQSLLSKLPLLKLVTYFITEQYHDKLVIDKHNRVSASSIPNEIKRYLQFPIVDILLKHLVSLLNIQSSSKKEIFLTCDYDILNVWYSIGKIGFIKQQVKAALKGNIKLIASNFRNYFQSNINIDANPYLRTDMFITDTNSEYFEVTNIAFWLIDYNNKLFDIKNNFDSPAVKQFLKEVKADNIQSGLHPSYNTFDEPNLLETQIATYSNIFNVEPEIVRFHFLHCRFPESFKMFEKTKIRKEFSYAYPDSLVFRGGRSSPIRMWDKEQNKAYEIISYPLSIMDGTLSDYLKLDYENALIQSIKKIDVSLKYGNCCDLLWHNNSVMYQDSFPDNYHPKLFKEIKKHLELNYLKSKS